MKKSPLRNRLALASAVAMFSSLPLSASACSVEPTTGEVCVVVMNWCPQNYMPADGRTLQINQYQALYSLIGIQFGGDARTTFLLPDLRGRSPIGTGAGPGLTSAIPIAQKVGQQVTTLNITQMPAHTHAAVFTPTVGPVAVTIPAQTGTLSVDASVPVSTTPNGAISGTTVALGAGQTGYLSGVKALMGSDPIDMTGPYTTSAPGTGAAKLKVNAPVSGNASTAAVNVNIQSVNGGTVANSIVGGNTPVVTQSPALGMTYCVAVNGMYPNRPD